MIVRLEQEVVGAGLDRLGFLLIAVRRDHHHREKPRRRPVAEAATDFVPVHARHDHVEEDEVELLFRDRLQRLLARGRRHDPIAARREHRVEKPDVLREVVDDQDRGCPSDRIPATAPAEVDARCERTYAGRARTSIGFSR